MNRSTWNNAIVLTTTVVITILFAIVLTIKGIGFRPLF